eukprot:1160222-Pelagomonas_calceolata.AAC.18
MTLLKGSRLVCASTSSTLRSPARAAARTLTSPPATRPATTSCQISSPVPWGACAASVQLCKRTAWISSANFAAPHGIGCISRSSISAASAQQAQHSSGSSASDTQPVPGSTRAPHSAHPHPQP